MKPLLILIFFFTVPLYFFGQGTDRIIGNAKIDIEPHLRVGTQIAFLPNLKKALSQVDYSMSQKPWFNISGGLTMTINNGAGFGFDYSASPSLNGLGSIQQIQGLVSYKFINNNKLAIIPEIGFGYQIINKILKNTSIPSSFDSLVLTNGNHARLNTKGNILSTSVILKFKNHRFTSIRIGYSFGINDRIWKSGDRSITNAPVEKANSLYLQFSFSIL